MLCDFTDNSCLLDISVDRLTIQYLLSTLDTEIHVAEHGCRTGRRLGRLDFGDAALVSDTLVANVLHPLNGNGSQQGTRAAADPAIAPKSWSASKRPRSDR